MDISHIIQEDGAYWPFYGPGYTNHLPMAQCALYFLGADEEQIRSFTKAYLSEITLQLVHSPREVHHINDHLGKREYYEAYVSYFKHNLSVSTQEQVVSDTLNYLLLGISSALYHGLIRIHYAVLLKDDDELARALASLACSYEPIEFNGEIILPEQLYDEISRYILERQGLFYLEGNINHKIEAILEGLLQLYIKTGSFIVLHTLTGFEALLSLRAYFDNFTHVVDVYMVSTLRVLLRITEEDYHDLKIDEIWEWDRIIDFVKACHHPHTIKFIYSLKKLSQHYDHDNFRLAAMIKLKLDHSI